MNLWSILTPDQVIAIANIVIAIGTLILAVGVPYAIQDASSKERDTFYATMDRAYFDIQKLIIDNPHLASTELSTKSPEQVVQYDAFAFVVWNFLESIYDYGKIDDDRKRNKELAETWECILKFESARHAEWFKRGENRFKFKKPFADYIEKSGMLNQVKDRAN